MSSQRIMKNLQGNYDEVTANYMNMKQGNRNQQGPRDMNNIIFELKNTLEGLKSRLDEAEDRISELEEKIEKNTQNEQEQEEAQKE